MSTFTFCPHCGNNISDKEGGPCQENETRTCPRMVIRATGKNSSVKYNTPRAKLLNEAMEIVHKDRNANYGSPEDNFKQIAALWTSYFQAVLSNTSQADRAMYIKFSSADVAVMSLLIKVARLAKSPNHHDSAVDIAGYAACLADIQESLRKQDGSASA